MPADTAGAEAQHSEHDRGTRRSWHTTGHQQAMPAVAAFDSTDADGCGSWSAHAPGSDGSGPGGGEQRFDEHQIPRQTAQALLCAVCVAAPLSGRGRLRAAPFSCPGRADGSLRGLGRCRLPLRQHRAISDAVLLSGDEDLREGVRAAQDYGVRVVLVGIACADGKSNNQSEELVLDADHLIVLGKPQLAPMFALRSPVAPRSTQPRPAVAADGSVVGTSARGAAAAFARKWLSAATDAEIADLHVGRPRIPRPLDVELLASVEQALNRLLQDDDPTRRDARSAFWGVSDGAVRNSTPVN